jgi:hypothetical protein
MTFVAAVMLMLLLPPSEYRWLLIPVGVYALLNLLSLRGRWLCLKARASRATKNILRLSIFLTFLAFLADATVATAGALEVFKVVPPNAYTPYALRFLQFLILLSPALSVLSTVLLLFYIRGLGVALERYEFGADAMGILVVAAVIYLVIPPFVVGLVWLSLFIRLLMWQEVAVFLGLPFLLLALLLLGLYPFIRYCNLLTRLRESILWQLDNENAFRHKRAHGHG